MRIGHGYDIHAFGPGSHVVVGGVKIAHDQGIVAHSDGDVVIHALCDALLGAAALGDIGQHFPDSDPQYRDADSRTLLRSVIRLLGAHGWVLHNADITVIAEAPRLAAHIPAMRAKLAADAAVTLSALSIKATTSEGLGHLGQRQGIAAHAVVLLEPAGETE